jgi:rubrerythrin
MANERRARDFYAGISRHSPDPAVQALAAEFAEEEQGHLTLLEEWLARLPEEDSAAIFDPDPPHAPD